MRSWSELDEVGRRQWGLITREQALKAMSKTTIVRYRASGLLVPVCDGVYRLAGAPPSWRQRMMAGCLAYGEPVALSHRAAALLWGLEGIAATSCEVTIPAGRSPRQRGIITHRAPLPAAHLTRRERIPVTSVGRTLLDLRGVVPKAVLERAVDQAYRQHLVTPKELSRLEAERTGGGYRGSGTLRKILDLRSAHPGVGESEWEDRVFGWIVEAGLEPPERQIKVTVGVRDYLIDLGYPERQVGLEFDGFDYHGRRWRFDADAVRYSELALAGWIVRRVTATQSREEVVAWVGEALRQGPSKTGGQRVST